MLANDLTDFLGFLGNEPLGYIVLGFVGLVLLIGVLIAGYEETRCGVCGLPIHRISYSWMIGGKKQRLCPRCSSRMKNKVSKAAFKSKFG